jgi:hypothetical protein
MQLEEQKQTATAPEIASQADSKQSEEPKSKRGGKRPGAGRKPNLAKVLLKGVSRNTILAAVEQVDVGSIIIGLLRSKREQTRIEALHFIFDRVMGKPKQDLSVTGGVIHAHVRDPLLASLPKEALEALARSYDEVLARYAKPILDASQDGPQNQIKSNTAIETVEVQSEGQFRLNMSYAPPSPPSRRNGSRRQIAPAV